MITPCIHCRPPITGSLKIEFSDLLPGSNPPSRGEFAAAGFGFLEDPLRPSQREVDETDHQQRHDEGSAGDQSGEGEHVGRDRAGDLGADDPFACSSASGLERFRRQSGRWTARSDRSSTLLQDLRILQP